MRSMGTRGEETASARVEPHGQNLWRLDNAHDGGDIPPTHRSWHSHAAHGRRPWRNGGVGTSGKMLVPLLGAIASLALGVAVVAIVLHQQEREKRQATERQLRQAVVENEDLQGRVQDLTKAKADVEDTLAKTHRDLTTSQEQLAKALDTQKSLSSAVEDREREISRLTKDLEQVRVQVKEASTQLSKAQTERDAVKRQLAQLEQSKSDFGSSAGASDRPTVELPKVLVTSATAPPGRRAAVAAPAAPATSTASAVPAAPVDGQVVVVNREYDFIVMNLGKNHGLSVGQELRVVRGDQVLGTVKVEKVYDELSAAAILPNSQKDDIREGDLVKLL